MAAGKPKVKRVALLMIMSLKMKDFLSGRTHIDPHAEALVRKAIKGNVKAGKSMTDIMEGKISRRRVKPDEQADQ